jgi:serine protease
MAGVVALMEAAARTAASPYDLSPDQLDSYLMSGDITVDIGNSGRDDEFGYGLIDAYKAVLKAQATSAPSPQLMVSPFSLNFGSNVNSAALTASNSGSGTLNILSVTDDASWLVVSGSGLGTYTVTVNRTALSPGTYNATITFDSDVNDVNIPVIMNVEGATSSSSANAGYHYVLLIDPDESDTYKRIKRVFPVGASDGRYNYHFTIEPAQNSRYVIVAGTDFDGDGYICDNGEACGGFLTLAQLMYLENIDDSMDNLNFTTSFVIQLTQETSVANEPNRVPYPVRHKKLMKRPRNSDTSN